MHRKKAFTLIELLVVIAVIALLMSIIMPAVDRTKNQVKTIICRSNLRQWGIAWRLFTNENNQMFMSGNEYQEIINEPSGFSGEAKIDENDHSWPLILLSYYLDEKLLCCPQAKQPPPLGQGGRETSQRKVPGIYSTWGLWVKYPTDFMFGSYGVNSWIYNRQDDAERRWRNLPVKGAYRVPLMLDCYWCEGYPTYYDEPPLHRRTGHFADSHNFMRRFCIHRHKTANNALLCDLSVKKVQLKQLWNLHWHRDWNQYNLPGPDWPLWMKRL